MIDDMYPAVSATDVETPDLTLNETNSAKLDSCGKRYGFPCSVQWESVS